MRISSIVLVAVLCSACGGEVSSARPSRTARASAPSRLAPASPAAVSTMETRGLTGSLSTIEVRRALEPRLEAFGGCFAPHTRRLRALGGRLELRFEVAVDGHVTKVQPIDSTVGHRDVERCVLEVAAATRFPRPHGGEAQFTWPLELDPPDHIRHPVTWDPSRVRGVVRRRGARVLRICRPPHSDAQYQVTTYVSRRGRVLSAGAAAREPGADTELDCVVRAVRRWRMPAAGRRQAKVTFEIG